MSDAGKARLRNLFCDLCILAVAGVFLYAAQSKILEPRQFVFDVKNYRMMPEEFLHLVAIFLPWWEIGAAIALIIPATRRAGAILIIGMLLMFIASISYAALYMGYNISCGCFGKGSTEAGLKTIALDVGLILATLIGLLPRRKVEPASGFPVIEAEVAKEV